MIEKSLMANAISAVLATLITWILVGDLAFTVDTAFLRIMLYTILTAFAVSVLVGLVFSYHKKCS
jgi:uncharacterized membrane-anchored protein YitT (DUF2179 family)